MNGDESRIPQLFPAALDWLLLSSRRPFLLYLFSPSSSSSSSLLYIFSFFYRRIPYCCYCCCCCCHYCFYLSKSYIYAVIVCVSEHHRHKLKQEKVASIRLHPSNVSYRIHLPGEHDGLSHSLSLFTGCCCCWINNSDKRIISATCCWKCYFMLLRDAGTRPVRDEGIYWCIMHLSAPQVHSIYRQNFTTFAVLEKTLANNLALFSLRRKYSARCFFSVIKQRV